MILFRIMYVKFFIKKNLRSVLGVAQLKKYLLYYCGHGDAPLLRLLSICAVCSNCQQNLLHF